MSRKRFTPEQIIGELRRFGVTLAGARELAKSAGPWALRREPSIAGAGSMVVKDREG